MIRPGPAIETKKHLPRCVEMEQDMSELLAQPRTQQCDGHCHFVEIITSLAHQHINSCAHRLKAALTLNSTLPLCTARSMNTTASSFSASAVFSTRPSQRASFVCISAKKHQYLTFAPHSERTFQLDISNVITQGTQVVLLESFLRYLRHIAIWIFIWIIRYIHFDIE